MMLDLLFAVISMGGTLARLCEHGNEVRLLFRMHEFSCRLTRLNTCVLLGGYTHEHHLMTDVKLHVGAGACGLSDLRMHSCS
jgi:hypothetical protein